jgi:hypothetical protein
MSKIRISLIVLFLSLAISQTAHAQRTAAPQSPALPKHLAVAQALVDHLDLQHTDYEHGAGSVSFTAPFASHTDCSGFADALLSYCYGVGKDQFRDWFGSGRPTAKRYHDAIAEEKGFKLIEHIQDVRPGDFLAVKYLSRKDNTGHVMLAAGRPQRMAAKEPMVPGTIQWAITVIDSSETGHGPTDTRHHQGAGGKDHDGLGEGVLRVYSDAGGNVVGFAWSTVAASKFKDPSDEHLVIGRLAPAVQ